MSATNQRSELPAGYRLHWYAVERVLGRGGFGITYLAKDENLDQPVAIKEFLPTDLAFRTSDNSIQPLSDNHIETYQWGLGRFLVEARTLAKFRHPNIVLVHSVFEANNTAYIVMEYETGLSLEQVYAAGNLKTESELTSLLISLMDGVECMHNEGFVHRDIKPSNIYLRDTNHPILLDFGSARQALGMETKTMTTMVSPGYAPFEQYNATREKDGQGPWTDIYALGSTIYRGLSGRDPSDALSLANDRIQGHQEVLDPATRVGKGRYSDQFLHAIDVSMRFNAAERPQSIAHWRDFLFGRNQISADAVTVLATGPVPSLDAAAADSVAVDGQGEQTAAAMPSVGGDGSQIDESANQSATAAAGATSRASVAAASESTLTAPDTGASASTEELTGAATRSSGKIWPIAAGVAAAAAVAAFFLIGGKDSANDSGIEKTPSTETVQAPDPSPIQSTVNTTVPGVVDDQSMQQEGQRPEVDNPTLEDLQALAGLDCAALSVKEAERQASSSTDESVVVSGFATDTALTEFNTAFTSMTSLAAADNSQITAFPDIFCNVLTFIGPLTMNGPADVSLQTTVDGNQLVEGDRLIVQFSSDAFDTNYFYVDYFSLDGNVLHMLGAKSEQSNQGLRGEAVLLGEEGGIERWDIAGPYGDELIALLVTNVPLDMGNRPEAESAEAYLSSLQEALAKHDSKAVRAAILKIQTRAQ